MNRKNYIEVEKFTKSLKRRILLASEIELQTAATKDLFETILNYEIFVYDFMYDLLESERICSHCDAASVK